MFCVRVVPQSDANELFVSLVTKKNVLQSPFKMLNKGHHTTAGTTVRAADIELQIQHPAVHR